METVAKVLEKLLDIWLFLLRRKKKKAGDAFVDFAEINSIIKNLVHGNDQLQIERALILRGHNGQAHKKLMPIGYKYVSVMACDYREPFEDVRTLYQNLPQDNEYVALIADIYVKQKVVLNVDTMNDGVLRNLYQKEGVKHSVLYFLSHNEEEVWFLSLATSQSGDGFDTVDGKNAIFLGVNRIRDIVKPYFK